MTASKLLLAAAAMCVLTPAAQAQSAIGGLVPSPNELAVFYSPVFTGSSNVNWAQRMDEFGIEGLFTVASVGSDEECRRARGRQSTLAKINEQLDAARIELETARAELAVKQGLNISDHDLKPENYVDIDDHLQVEVRVPGKERTIRCDSKNPAPDPEVVPLCTAKEKLRTLGAARREIQRESQRRVSRCADWSVELGVGYSQTAGLTRGDSIFSYNAAPPVPVFGTIRHLPNVSVYFDRNFDRATLFAGASMSFVQFSGTSYIDNGISAFNRVPLAVSGDTFGYGLHAGGAVQVVTGLSVFLQVSYESQLFSGVKYTLTGSGPNDAGADSDPARKATGLPGYLPPNLSLNYLAVAFGAQFHIKD